MGLRSRSAEIIGVSLKIYRGCCKVSDACSFDSAFLVFLSITPLILVLPRTNIFLPTNYESLLWGRALSSELDVFLSASLSGEIL